MSFTENVFPVEISQGSSGGAAFNTTIVTTKAGFEARNGNWSQSRHRFNVSVGVRGVDDFESLKTFFMAMNGMLQGFRFKDWGDYNSCGINGTVSATDQTIGNGDGSTTDYQLVKKYTNGFTYQRTIYKPVAGTVLVSIDDVSVLGFALDTTTGIISFDDITRTINGASSIGGGLTRLNTVTDHGLSAGESIYLSLFTGDWAGLNGSRFIVVARSALTFDISFDSSSYAAYSSNAGQMDTIPQSGEVIKAGFEFDVPCRFDTDEMQSAYDNFQIFDTNLSVVEIRV